MKKFVVLLLILIAWSLSAQFGKNKVQYGRFSYYYIQSEHFDIYFTKGGDKIAAFTAVAAESALVSLTKSFKYNINNRLKIIVYNSQNEFQQTNVIQEYLEEGIGGVTELFKNRIVLPYTGSYSQLRHVIHHELVHAFMNDMLYGGSIQSIISNNITLNIPLWFIEGMAEYQSLGWDVNSDMYLRDAVINESLPDIDFLNGYFAYRGGQSVLWYIDRKYGKEKVGELLTKVRGSGSFEGGLKNAIGLGSKELSEAWKKDQKLLYWPDVAKYKDPPDFSKQLTDHTKDGGFYNTSPAISPQGDKLAFISNRDDFFDVFVMSLTDLKNVKKIIKGNTTNDFEQLNILTPGLAWSPDGKKIVISAKAGPEDAIYIINTETGEEKKLLFNMRGISSVIWSPNGDKIAFIGVAEQKSDIFIYDLNSSELKNLTNDVFDDTQPAFSSDGKMIFFSSRRDLSFSSDKTYNEFDVVNFEKLSSEIYAINIETGQIQQITKLNSSSETEPIPLISNSGIVFISDYSGINNIYVADLKLQDSINQIYRIITEQDIKPVTNSISGIYQLSLSADNKKLVYSAIHKSAYNLFLINNPFEKIITDRVLEPTYFITSLRKSQIADSVQSLVVKTDTTIKKNEDGFQIATGNITDTSRVFGQTSRTNFNDYIFGDNFANKSESIRDTFELVTDGRDALGNFKINQYKINFSPDLVYANAGYSTFYGLLGTAQLSFSDLMGDHQIIGFTSLQIDLKNSDYGAAYFYLPERTDFGIMGFHTARFLGLDNGFTAYLYRFRNYGATFSFSYPIDKFYRFEGSLSWTNLKKENLEIPDEPSENSSLIVPTVSFVHDNTMWGFTAPVRGSRYNLTLFGVPPFKKDDFSFGTATIDYRTYLKFWTDYSFGFRVSGGYSFGRNPQKFMLGGTENWINRQFTNNRIPINTVEDFLFLTPVYPMRGFNYGEQLGTKYALLNLELRYPLIKFLLAGPLPILFQNVVGTAFIDVGSSWTNDKSFRGTTRDNEGRLVTQDLLIGSGFGARLYFLYFLLKFDVAWSYDIRGFSVPKYYFSLGTDF